MNNNLQKRIGNFPVKATDLNKWLLVNKAKLKSQITAIKALNKLEEGIAVRAAALSDTQDLAEELLYAEARLGEILCKSTSKGTFKKGRETSLPEGIDKKQSHYAQELHRHQDIIAEIVAKARESDAVPLRQHVLTEIKKQKPKPAVTPLPEGVFDVIYADPPWKYDNSGLAGTPEDHYDVMELDAICELEVEERSAQNAVLFLWSTNPFLEDALTVAKSWGFQYKTNICWEKLGRSTYGKLGFYVYGKHELLLIATRGSMLPDGELPESVVKALKSEHSRKPDVLYEIIEQMYSNGRYLELFARNRHSKKWQVWGNEL